MADTYAQQLDRVQTAIAAIEEHGQIIQSGGKILTRADLATLYEREKRLLGLTDGSSGTMQTRVVEF